MIHKNNSQKVKRSILTSYNSLQLIWGPQMIPPQAFQGVICLDNRKSFLCVINILVVLSLSESPALSKENSNTVYRCLRAANVMTILVPPIENKGWKYHPWEGSLLGEGTQPDGALWRYLAIDGLPRKEREERMMWEMEMWRNWKCLLKTSSLASAHDLEHLERHSSLTQKCFSIRKQFTTGSVS